MKHVILGPYLDCVWDRNSSKDRVTLIVCSVIYVLYQTIRLYVHLTWNPCTFLHFKVDPLRIFGNTSFMVTLWEFPLRPKPFFFTRLQGLHPLVTYRNFFSMWKQSCNPCKSSLLLSTETLMYKLSKFNVFRYDSSHLKSDAVYPLKLHKLKSIFLTTTRYSLMK